MKIQFFFFFYTSLLLISFNTIIKEVKNYVKTSNTYNTEIDKSGYFLSKNGFIKHYLLEHLTQHPLEKHESNPNASIPKKLVPNELKTQEDLWNLTGVFMINLVTLSEVNFDRSIEKMKLQ